MTRVAKPKDRRSAIRAIFLSPRLTYSVESAADLLLMTAPELRKFIDLGCLEVEPYSGGWRVTWEHLAAFALWKWTYLIVTTELGSDVTKVFPPMALPRFATFYLPDYQLRRFMHSRARTTNPKTTSSRTTSSISLRQISRR